MANNREILKDFLQLYGKGCTSIKLSFNDGSDVIFTDGDFTHDVIETIKEQLACQLKEVYCRQPREPKVEPFKKEDKK